MIALLSTFCLALCGAQQFTFYPKFEDFCHQSVGILLLDEVCQELGLGQKQIEKIDAALAEKKKQYNEGLARVRKEDSPAAQKQFDLLCQRIQKEAIEAVEKALPPDALPRYYQLVIQREGSKAFADPKVQKGLGLTEEQSKKVAAVARETEAEFAKMKEFSSDDANRFEALKIERTLAVFTAEQKARWEQIQGKPFKVPSGISNRKRKLPN